MEIDVERFCILKARVGGHRVERCAQCKALKALAVEVNNETLESIVEVLQKTADKENAVLDPVKAIKAIQSLKYSDSN